MPKVIQRRLKSASACFKGCDLPMVLHDQESLNNQSDSMNGPMESDSEMTQNLTLSQRNVIFGVILSHFF